MTPDVADPQLARALAPLAPPGVLIGHRLIAPGDEDALLPAERPPAAAAPALRRASGAARIVARELLARLGHPGFPLRRGAAREPLWPAGITGSLAHDDRVAVAAVGRQREVGSLGIDVEPAAALPPDMFEMVVVTPRERAWTADDPLRGRLLFCAKEAVYKAVYPLERVFLEFPDIEVDLAAGQAVTGSGRKVALHCCVASHLVVLAVA